MPYKFGVVLLVVTYMSGTTALPPCVCTRNMDPVCGSDGETYNNPCLLECKRVTSNKDLKIEKFGSCGTFDFRMGKVAYRGVSKRSDEEFSIGKLACTCTSEKHPVCGTDGNTYSNPCMLNCAREGNQDLHVDHDGACSNEIRVVDIAEQNPY